MNYAITKCDMLAASKNCTLDPLLLAASKNCTLDPLLLEEYPVGTLFWAVHHDRIVEPLCDPLVERLEYVLQNKPQHELPVRLEAIRPVKNTARLPTGLVELAAATVTAVQEYRAAVAAAVENDGAVDAVRASVRAYERYLNTHFDELCAQWLEEYPCHPMMTRFGGLCTWSRA